MQISKEVPVGAEKQTSLKQEQSKQPLLTKEQVLTQKPASTQPAQQKINSQPTVTVEAKTVQTINTTVNASVAKAENLHPNIAGNSSAPVNQVATKLATSQQVPPTGLGPIPIGFQGMQGIQANGPSMASSLIKALFGPIIPKELMGNVPNDVAAFINWIKEAKKKQKLAQEIEDEDLEEMCRTLYLRTNQRVTNIQFQHNLT